MSVAWFIVPYRADFLDVDRPARVCQMDDYTPLIQQDNGRWEEDEILSGHAVVKVVAQQATIDTISSDSLFFKIPNEYLDTLLGEVPVKFRNQLLQKSKSLGYSDIIALHDITVKTFLQKLTNLRSKFSYNAQLKKFVQGAPAFKPSNLIRIDSRVKSGVSNNTNIR